VLIGDADRIDALAAAQAGKLDEAAELACAAVAAHESAPLRLELARSLGLVFMGAIVAPVYLVPALAVVLALGIAAESHPNWPTALTVGLARQRRWPAVRLGGTSRVRQIFPDHGRDTGV
jgi:hypothetical protein